MTIRNGRDQPASPHFFQCATDNARHCSSPSGMNSRHDGMLLTGVKENRNAICSLHGNTKSRDVRKDGIRIRRTSGIFDVNHISRMHLARKSHAPCTGRRKETSVVSQREIPVFADRKSPKPIRRPIRHRPTPPLSVHRHPPPLRPQRDPNRLHRRA